MLTKFKLQLKKQAQYWYWFLFLLSLIVGILVTLYVAKAQDDDMRNNLFTYASTIEQSIDWRPHATILNTKPSQLKQADLAALEIQLKNACKANRDCHFIYLLYKEANDVKFLLDASPQPPSEISNLGDVFYEATNPLKNAMDKQQVLVEGPIADRWGTWVSVRIPIKLSVSPQRFNMLNIDVAVKDWNAQIVKSMLAPGLVTLVFLSVLGGFIYQNKKREKLLAQLYRSTSALSEMANYDPLTGLPNRRLLEDRMMQALKAAKRSDNLVGVLFLDLDLFKIVNDSYGHVIGDALLKQVSKRLTELLRAEDTVARIGGDEFVILLPTLTDSLQAVAAAEKVVHEIAQPFKLEQHCLSLGVSVGIALYPDHADEPSDLISLADIAMYVAKHKGRNGYSVYMSE
jgi:diguanylate cyclase (GGDEF)-like protein